MPVKDATVRAVLDTNVWISGIFFNRGAPARLLQAWRDGQFEIIVTTSTLSELEVVLQRKVEQFRADPNLVAEWLAYVDAYATSVKVKTSLEGTSRDPQDDMMLEAAVAGMAHFLVTGDKDLLVLAQIGETQIVSPRRFLEALEE